MLFLFFQSLEQYLNLTESTPLIFRSCGPLYVRKTLDTFASGDHLKLPIAVPWATTAVVMHLFLLCAVVLWEAHVAAHRRLVCTYLCTAVHNDIALVIGHYLCYDFILYLHCAAFTWTISFLVDQQLPSVTLVLSNHKHCCLLFPLPATLLVLLVTHLAWRVLMWDGVICLTWSAERLATRSPPTPRLRRNTGVR